MEGGSNDFSEETSITTNLDKPIVKKLVKFLSKVEKSFVISFLQKFRLFSQKIKKQFQPAISILNFFMRC